MPDVKSFVFEISNALLWPVLVLLAVFAGATVYWLGAAVRETLDRRRERRAIESLFKKNGRPAADDEILSNLRDRPWRKFLEEWMKVEAREADLEKCVRDCETAMTRRIETVALSAKIGPMLGLAGTLIPLGPALESLGRGSTQALAENLMMSFATTVVGLAIAGPCFWIATVRRRWYEQDIADMDNLAVRVLGGGDRRGAA